MRASLFIVIGAIGLAVSQAHATLKVVDAPKLKVYLVHNGAVPIMCPDKTAGCLREATGTLEIRFRPNAGVSNAVAWRAVSEAYGGVFYGTLEDSICRKGMEMAQHFARDVREELKAAHAPVHGVEVYLTCQPRG